MLSHTAISVILGHKSGQDLQTLMIIDTDWIGRIIFKHHWIMTPEIIIFSDSSLCTFIPVIFKLSEWILWIKENE